MRVLLALVLSVLIGTGVPAEAKVRALFVGIDTYAFSQETTPANALFPNLKGAVGDARRIKAALKQAYNWDLDQADPANCAANNRNDTSITLFNECATYKNILDALNSLISASAQGDTVIFYYAGHGSQLIDNLRFDQPSAWSDTIFPYNARDPNSPVATEIIDRQLNVIIENANHVQGANVVTIFDSCHSRTGVRGFVTGTSTIARDVPRLETTRRLPPSGKLLPGKARVFGYRVHLSAADDKEVAREVGPSRDAPHAGVFTTALIKAIGAMPHANFADMIEEVQRSVEFQDSSSMQHPQGEGAMTRSFEGGDSQSTVLIPASASGWTVKLGFGSLSGVTAGSTFALYRDSTSATAASAAPLATGHVAQVDGVSASLALDTTPATPLPPNLIARETSHVFGSTTIGVTLDLGDGQWNDEAAKIIATIPFARLIAVREGKVTKTVSKGESQAYVQAFNALTDGPMIFTNFISGLPQLPTIHDPQFADRLRQALNVIAQRQAILSLRTDPAKADLTICVDNRPILAPAAQVQCPPESTADHAMRPQVRTLATRQIAHIAVVNTRDTARQVYVFYLQDDGSILLLTPQDAPLARDRPQMVDFIPYMRGDKQFLVLATDTPINAAALAQSGGGARDPAACKSVLEKLLCEAKDGTRDPATPRVGGWTAIVKTVKVVEPAVVEPQSSGEQ